MATTADVRNPWTGEIVHTVSLADTALLDRALNTATEAFATTRHLPPAERAALLTRIAVAIETRRDEFAAMIVEEAGKPITLAHAEVARAVITFTDAAEQARRTFDEPLDADAYAPGTGHLAIGRRYPLGVVLGIGPFNFPLNLVAHKIAPALACGCTMLLKPSPRTPAVAAMLAELILDCGAVPGQINVIHCDNALTMALVDDARIKAVSFTGSAAVGWQMKARALKQKVTLELGGNAAVVVHDDADLAAAVPLIAAGAFGYAGQSCISVQRVYVHRRIYPGFRDALIAYTLSNVVTGDPSNRQTLNGPMIDRPTLDRAAASICGAIDAGGRLLCGGEVDGPCLRPALLDDVPLDHPLVAEEAFAPIAVLTPYDEFDDALAAVNASRYGLQAGVFTRDIDRAFQAFESLDVGGVLINQTPTARMDNLPYGGVKDSGRGREGVRYAIEDMTERRTLIFRR